jgi:uncharacterized membrane protein YdbT with pleckstrin-like domain
VTVEEDRVGFPDSVLTEDEEVVLRLRPHWRTAVRPVVVLIVALTVIVITWVMLPRNHGGQLGVSVIGSVAVVLALVKGVWPLLVRRCTHWVFTDERILLQAGVLRRDRRDLPLAQINDHVLRQSLLDRVFGSGTMTIDSIGERGPAELVAVPRVRHVHATLYELIEEDHEREDDEEDQLEPPERPARPERRQPGRR